MMYDRNHIDKFLNTKIKKQKKNTVLKITDGREWLVLIDELFKGTNIQDAMHCSTAVIKGLLKIKSSLFILSTHLYEIGEELKPYSNISFLFLDFFLNGGGEKQRVTTKEEMRKM